MSTVVKITELPAATSPVSPTDVTAVIQNGVTKKAFINQLGYLAAGNNAQTRTISSKLQDVVSVKDFGAVGDGVTNDRAAIQAALDTGKSVLVPAGTYLFNTSISFTASGQCIYGLGNDSALKSGPGAVYIQSLGFNNLSICDLQIDGTGTDGGILINDNSSNFDVLNVYFYRGDQRVWLWNCNHVTVQNCVFDNTGYAIISQLGNISNYVLVDGNIAKNLTGDFVEANNATSSVAEFWTVSNNIFTGSANYPVSTAEQRFVGITNVRGAIISNNLVRNVAGDAAIHLEYAFGETIVSNNVFDNCLGYGGNSGYIYLLNSAEDVIIDGNIFLRTDASLPAAYAVDTSSGTYNNSITFTNNRVMGVATNGNFSGIRLHFQQGANTISGNTFENLKYAIDHNAVFGSTLVSGNKFQSCQEGIYLSVSATSNAGDNWTVVGNDFKGTAGSYDIIAIKNTNGTGSPKKWSIQGNTFSKEVTLQGLSGGVVGSTSDAEDITISNNVFGNTASLTVAGTMSRRVRFNNVFNDPTAGGGTTLVQDLRDYANDAAAASGGIPVGGIYRNGSVIQVRVS